MHRCAMFMHIDFCHEDKVIIYTLILDFIYLALILCYFHLRL